MSQVRRVPEEIPDYGTHGTFLAGRWQNSNSTKPPHIGQAYFSTCCGGRLLLVALALSRRIAYRSSNCSLSESRRYPFSAGIHNTSTFTVFTTQYPILWHIYLMTRLTSVQTTPVKTFMPTFSQNP